jgi:L-lactate dehydrogenase (cytochrome)
MVQRQLPRPAEITELMQFKRPSLNAKKRRLQAALTVHDLRAIAKRRTPKAAFDYADGAADEEISLARARQAFSDVEFNPSILRGAAEIDTSCEVFGGHSALPFGIAPTGFTRLMQTEGEIAGASAAGAAGIPFSLSTLGTASIEDVRAANPAGRNWFQLYVMRDREISYELTRRAAAAGFDTLLFTVDTPVAGARLRDKRNGFSIPPQLSLGTVVNAIPRPSWWIDFLTTPKLEFASLTSTGGTVGELLDAAMDPTISFRDLEVIRSLWPGKIVVKGVQNVEDAKKLSSLGVTGIVLSNHGGRQLDRAPVPFRLLPEVVREVGKDVEIAIDTGIMSGADIVAAIALGAKFTLIGRAYLYGLMAGGRDGVDRMIAILRDQIERTMKLLGAATLGELTPGHVTQLARAHPIHVGSGAAPELRPARYQLPRRSFSRRTRPTSIDAGSFHGPGRTAAALPGVRGMVSGCGRCRARRPSARTPGGLCRVAGSGPRCPGRRPRPRRGGLGQQPSRRPASSLPQSSRSRRPGPGRAGHEAGRAG